MKKMIIKRYAVIVTTSLSLLFTASLAAAAPYTCTGRVSGVSVNADGSLIPNSIGPVTSPRLCNVETVANGVTVNACRRYHAMLITAQLTGRTVTIGLDGINSAATCETLPSGGHTAGFYFLRID